MSTELLNEVNSLKERIHTLEVNERENMKMMIDMSAKQDQIFDKIVEMKADIKEDIKEMKDGAVLKVEFQPIQKWVNTVIYIVVSAVVVAVLSFVIVKFK